MEVNARVWIRDPEAVWVAATVTEVKVSSAAARQHNYWVPCQLPVDHALPMQISDKGAKIISAIIDSTGEKRDVTVQGLASGGACASPTRASVSALEYDDIKLSNDVPRGLTPDQAALAVHDLAHLTQLHEASILNAVLLRFQQDCIYTCTGRILLAVNPFKDIPLYIPEVMDMYVSFCFDIVRLPDCDLKNFSGTLLGHCWSSKHYQPSNMQFQTSAAAPSETCGTFH